MEYINFDLFEVASINDLTFKQFKSIWKEKKLHFLHLLRKNKELPSSFYGDIFKKLIRLKSILTEKWKSCKETKQKMIIIFILYVIYATQHSIRNDYVKIELPFNWKFIKTTMEIFEKENLHEPIRIFILMAKKAFLNQR
ncbi:hypothetical protein MHBO_003505 [Bonamia ostreae]|uniref:Reverse transcriptase N-terminal domain-containing protein n=1 Tax=Bonamia ostreae TaxID=126728 RepID=A0ABV2AQN9_9EUKA